MPRIVLKTIIRAPIDRCFDLSRSIDLHKVSTEQTNEEAIDGVTSGLISLDESVTWRAKHFGIDQTNLKVQASLQMKWLMELLKGLDMSIILKLLKMTH